MADRAGEAVTAAVPTPECDRMLAVADESQRIGDFLDWLEQQGMQLTRWAERTETLSESCSRCSRCLGEFRNCRRCGGSGSVEVTRSRQGFEPDPRGFEQLLADYYSIDLRKIESERRAILASLRATP